MVLLRVLHDLSPTQGWELTVAHFNHQLRRRASDGDEAFVKRAARKLSLPAITACGNVKPHAKRTGLSIEMAARELRHAFLAQTARRLRICCVALAHHADDQVELFFLRLLRGSGSEGIAGMKWKSPSPAASGIRLVRPLLGVNKAELEAFARENKISFRPDSTNDSKDYQRNRIRHELLPLLRKHYQPALERTVLRTTEILSAESRFVAEAAENWFKQAEASRPTARRQNAHASFRNLPVAVQRRSLQLQLQRLKLPADFELIERLRLNPNLAVSVTAQNRVLRSEAGLIELRPNAPSQFCPDEFAVNLSRTSGVLKLGKARCHWKIERVGGKGFKPIPGRELFDADKVGATILLRHWRAGDRFQPIGMKKPVKLQDWFTNRKVPRQRRHDLLVAEAADGRIFWVEDQRIGERFKLTGQTRRRLAWNWQRK